MRRILVNRHVRHRHVERARRARAARLPHVETDEAGWTVEDAEGGRSSPGMGRRSTSPGP
ncbi:MAG TPA: hypothetical protein VFN33_06945 [Gaiellaceae bacterium]|nr:hypothetical protein [Gaiellaceae bacterium]